MIGTIVSLYVLATLDAAFSGICAASGRNALIEKRGYFLNSMWQGALWGQAASFLGLCLLCVVVSLSPNSAETSLTLVEVGNRMVLVYGIYAAIVLSTFAIRVIPSVDVRSLTSTIGFGPLTLIRPAVIVVGLVWGAMLHPSPPIIFSAFAIGAPS